MVEREYIPATMPLTAIGTKQAHHTQQTHSVPDHDRPPARSDGPECAQRTRWVHVAWFQPKLWRARCRLVQDCRGPGFERIRECPGCPGWAETAGDAEAAEHRSAHQGFRIRLLRYLGDWEGYMGRQRPEEVVDEKQEAGGGAWRSPCCPYAACGPTVRIGELVP